MEKQPGPGTGHGQSMEQKDTAWNTSFLTEQRGSRLCFPKVLPFIVILTLFPLGGEACVVTP